VRTIEIDDDIYEFLLRNAIRIGETASDILRRVLPISAGQDSNLSGNGQRADAGADALIKSSELRDYLRSGEFRSQADATKRYLTILGKVHAQNRDDFGKVQQAVSGRQRTYFSQRRADLEASGQRVHPRKIPGSNFWALTNENTRRKRRMLRQVLLLFGYTPEAIEVADSALE
jgi:negative modulator of initiation of replication